MIRLILALTAPRTIFQSTHDYKAELERCIRAWRSNAGYLKDIPIHLSTDIEGFKAECEVHYLKYHLNDRFGYAVVHESGAFFQSLFPADTLIHIDLDMTCLKPIPPDLLLYTCVGGYDRVECQERLEHSKHLGLKVFTNTDLIITPPKSEYYREYLKLFRESTFWAYEEMISDLVVKAKNYRVLYGYESDFN